MRPEDFGIARWTGTVTDVHDGDTFTVQIFLRKKLIAVERIRLLGVYAPELNQPGGIEARGVLRQYLMPLEQKNLVYIDGKKEVYSFDRLLADAYVQDPVGSAGELESVAAMMNQFLNRPLAAMGRPNLERSQAKRLAETQALKTAQALA